MVLNTDQYINKLPEAERFALQQLRQIIISLIPGVTETISTNVPAFYYKGKYLVSFSATKDHLALLVMQGGAMKSLERKLETYDKGSKIIRFTPEKPLPHDLIGKIVYFRKAEIDQK